jgi:hypothetical protein
MARPLLATSAVGDRSQLLKGRYWWNGTVPPRADPTLLGYPSGSELWGGAGQWSSLPAAEALMPTLTDLQHG